MVTHPVVPRTPAWLKRRKSASRPAASTTGPVLAGPHATFLVGLAHELRILDPDGTRLGRIPDPAAAARRAVAVTVDAADAWTEHLGAFYDVEGVRTLLGRAGAPISRQAVSKRRDLLALTTGSGRVVYPQFQFEGGGPLPGLGAVLHELPPGLVSRWTVASWFVSGQADLHGQSPLQLLREGAEQVVVDAARSWAQALAA